MGSQESEKGTGGRSLLTRVAALVLALLVVLGAVSMFLLSDSRHLDRIRRWLVYGESTEENLYAFAADSRNRYGLAGERLVVLSQNSIQFLDDDGTARFARQVQLSRPALQVEGELAVAYDIGGRNLYLFSAEEERLHLTLEEGDGFISARLSAGGYLAVVSEKGGYRGVVDVYDSRQGQVFTYNSSSRFLIDASVSADSTAVSIVTLGEAEGSFSSEVLRYPLDQQEPSARTALKDHLSMDLANMGERLVSVSDSDICFLGAGGELTGSFFYDSLYLRRYSLGGEDFAALLLNRYRSGSIGTLMVVDASGSLVAARDVTEEVLDISAAGGYVAVLYGDTLVIYDRSLQEYARLTGTGYASHVLMNADGSAIVIGGNQAWRYLP